MGLISHRFRSPRPRIGTEADSRLPQKAGSRFRGDAQLAMVYRIAAGILLRTLDDPLALSAS
jgi:hypothetical protein